MEKMRYVMTACLLLSTAAFFVSLYNFSFVGAVITFLLMIGFATLEMHFEGQTEVSLYDPNKDEDDV